MTDQLPDLVQAALRRIDAMTPEQKKAHWDAQRESWVRGEMALSKAEKEYGCHTRRFP